MPPLWVKLSLEAKSYRSKCAPILIKRAATGSEDWAESTGPEKASTSSLACSLCACLALHPSIYACTQARPIAKIRENVCYSFVQQTYQLCFLLTTVLKNCAPLLKFSKSPYFTFQRRLILRIICTLNMKGDSKWLMNQLTMFTSSF